MAGLQFFGGKIFLGYISINPKRVPFGEEGEGHMKTKSAGTKSGESDARNLEAESIRSRAESTIGCVKTVTEINRAESTIGCVKTVTEINRAESTIGCVKTVKEIRRSSARGPFIAGSLYLVLNSLSARGEIETEV